jgi:WD40 repeat protein
MFIYTVRVCVCMYTHAHKHTHAHTLTLSRERARSLLYTGAIWDAKNEKRTALLQGHDGTNDCLCLRRDDADACPIQGHRGDVLSVSWAPDGKTIATCSRDGTVRLWKSDGAPIWSTVNQHAGVNGVAISPVRYIIDAYYHVCVLHSCCKSGDVCKFFPLCGSSRIAAAIGCYRLL